MSYNRTPQHIVDQMLDMRGDGIDPVTIARQFDVSAETVRRYTRAAAPPSPKALSNRKRQKLLRAAGWA